MTNEYAIDIDNCRKRQRRLLDAMRERQLELAVLVHPENVQWIVGRRFAWLFQTAVVMDDDGQVLLVAPSAVDLEGVAADSCLTYAANWHSTLRNDQRAASNEVLVTALGSRLRSSRVGVEFAEFPAGLAQSFSGTLVDLDPSLYGLRRRKENDELRRIKKAISATEKMYEHARGIIRPGISELEVFSALQAAAAEELGEMLTGTGNDYQCGSRGGPPRNHRTAKAGELYILDLGPAFRGYFADNCRTIAVSEVDSAQQEAWEHVMGVFPLIESGVRPGVSCKQLFEQVQQKLDQAPVGDFNHHLGHGIGLFPHETPHLNPNWDDLFEEGDVFTAEPGLYAPELRAGMRIENNYRVTADGVELLTPFSCRLKD